LERSQYAVSLPLYIILVNEIPFSLWVCVSSSFPMHLLQECQGLSSVPILIESLQFFNKSDFG